MRRLLSISLLALLLAPGAASAEPDKLPELAGTTVIEGSANTFVDVALPKRIAPSEIFRHQAPTVETDGFYVRVTLRRMQTLREMAEPHWFGPPGFSVESFGIERYRSGGYSSVGRGERGAIEPGAYRLYLHTTVPARVTLKIPPLSGARVFRPRRAARGTEARLLEPIQDLPMGVSAAGGSGDLKTDGDMRFWAVFGGTEDRTFDRSEFCTYMRGDEEATAPYRPGCPQGFGVSHVRRQETSLHWEMHSYYFNFKPGRYGIGANMTHGGTAREVVVAIAAFSSWDDDAPEVIENRAPVVEDLDAEAAPPAAAAPPAPAPAPVADPLGQAAARGPRPRGPRLPARGVGVHGLDRPGAPAGEGLPGSGWTHPGAAPGGPAREAGAGHAAGRSPGSAVPSARSLNLSYFAGGPPLHAAWDVLLHSLAPVPPPRR